MNPTMNRSPALQQGAMLIVCLIILLVMTIIGITNMKTTTMEEKMTGNTRDLNLAFQAAEAALRDGEALIDAIVSPTAFDNTAGLYNSNDNEPDYTDTTSWNTTNSRAYPDANVTPTNTPIPLVTSQPQFYITLITEGIGSNSNASGNIAGYGQQQPGTTVTAFTVTARGTGGSGNTAVILQSRYGKQF